MQVLDLAKVGSLHHAYLVATGNADEIAAMLHARGVEIKGNPDYIALTFGELLVDDARIIAQYAFLKSVGQAKYFIITFGRATDAAQNALLKVVEEAPGNSHFFFCTPSAGAVLPTLRSRMIEVRGASPDEAEPEAAAFVKLGYAARLGAVEKLVTAAQRSGDRSQIRQFARSLVCAHPSRATLTALRYLEHSGTSPKLVLAHLAVTLPLAPTN